MILTIDIGNTNVMAGAYRDGSLEYHWRLDSRAERTSDEWGLLLLNHIERRGGRAEEFAGVAVSSVVPGLDFAFARMSRDYFSREALFVTAALDLGIRVLYRNPMQVGADRLCNAVAAIGKYETPIIIIDFGTATTYDIITGENEYRGGVIAPGVETAAGILHRQTARLPLVGMAFPETVIGITTETSIQSGILYGALVEMEGLVGLIEREIGTPATVIATGGYSELFAGRSDRIHYIEPFLTLDGLHAIYARLNAPLSP